MPEVISRAESQPSGTDALVLATISFAVCFAAWGLIGASAPFWKIALQLTDSQKGVLVAVPVLLGSLARIPVGMLADRFGGRVVFSALMLVSAVPGALAPIVAVHYGFRAFVADGFFLGLAGSSFAVGVSFVFRWYPKAKQGTALGIYGIGNIGQSAAVFFGPVLAIALASRAGELGSGWAKVFYGTAAMLAVWALVFALAARNPPAAVRPANVAEMLHTLGHEPLAWALSAFYFLTFGGFVAFGIYSLAFLETSSF